MVTGVYSYFFNLREICNLFFRLRLFAFCFGSFHNSLLTFLISNIPDKELC